MRKIEEQMVRAIREGRDWRGGNTVVRQWEGTGLADVLLHGNHIARTSKDGAFTEPNRRTFARWPTATTRSRLRALGVDAYIRNGRAFIDGEECEEC